MELRSICINKLLLKCVLRGKGPTPFWSHEAGWSPCRAPWVGGPCPLIWVAACPCDPWGGGERVGQNSLGACGRRPPQLWCLQGNVSLSGGIQGLLPIHSALGFPGGCQFLAGRGPGPRGRRVWREGVGRWPPGPSRPWSAFPARVIHSASPAGRPTPLPASPVFPPHGLPAWGSVRVSMLGSRVVDRGAGQDWPWGLLAPKHLLSQRPG